MFKSKILRNRRRDRVRPRAVLTVPFPDETWTCHVCGDERPDEKIGVFARERVTRRGIRFRENVRHCIDRTACVDEAPEVFFVPKDEL